MAIMKNFNIKLTIAIICFNAYTLQAQEISKKKTFKDGISEKYFVLKDNKTVKQGQYLITYNDYFFKNYIIEFGQYDKNMRAGKWFSFYYKDPSNFVKSVGNYKDGKKEGSWAYYYMGNASTVPTIFGSEKRTKIIEPKKGEKEFKVEIDSSGQQLLSIGQYTNDIKSGFWEYFSNSGYLIHKFDHSSNKFVENNLREHGNDFVTFLGGPERFQNFYYTGQQEINLKSPITKTSEVIYEMDKNGDYRYVKGYGDEVFKEHVANILLTIPKEWIYLDLVNEKKLQIISKVTYTSDAFKKYNFFLDYKVVN
jgi:hypothetical protein